MTAGIAPPSRLPIFGRSGLTRRSTRSDSSPISSTSRTLTSSRTRLEQRVALAEVAAGQREPQPGERLADADAGRCRAASGPARRPSGPSPSPSSRASIAKRRELVGRPAGQVDGVRRGVVDGRDEVAVHRLRQERQERRERSGRRDTSAAWSVANAAARSAASSFRENRFRERRRYQVERSSMNVEIAASRPTRVVVGEPRPRRRRRGRPPATGSSGPSAVARRAAARASRSEPGVQPASRRIGRRRTRRRSRGRAARGAPRRRRASRTGCCPRAAPDVNIQRMTSTPIRSAASSNSIALPQLLCIGRPSSPKSVA